MALTKIFNKFALIAATLLLSVLCFAPQADAGEAGQTSYYVKTNETVSGGGPRAYSYSYGGAPKKKWGKSSNPYSTIESAIDDAVYNGNQDIYIYFCDRGTPWASGTSSRAYEIQSLYKSINSVTLVPMSSSCTTIKNHELLVPDSHVANNMIEYLQIGMSGASGGFTFKQDLWMEADLDFTMKFNKFDNASAWIHPVNLNYNTSYNIHDNEFDGTKYSTSPSLFIADAHGVETYMNTYKNSNVGLYTLNSTVDSIIGEYFTDTKMTISGGTVKSIVSTVIENNRGIGVSGGAFIQEIAGLTLLNTGSVPGSIGIMMSNGNVEQIRSSIISNYEMGVDIDASSSVYSINYTDFHGPSASNIQVNVDGASALKNFSENTMTATGYGTAVVLDGNNAMQNFNSNSISHFENGVHVVDADIDVFENNDTYMVSFPLIVNKGDLPLVRNNTLQSGQTGVSCESHQCHIAEFSSNEVSNFEIGLHVAAGAVNLVDSNEFNQFSSKGILMEAAMGEFDYYHAGLGEHPGSTTVVDYGTVITENLFDNGSAAQEQPGLGQETIAIALSNADVAEVLENEYDSVDSFAILVNGSRAYDLTDNSYRHSARFYHSSFPALGVYGESFVDADKNTFHVPGSSMPVHDTVVELEDSHASITNHEFYAFDTDVDVELGDATVSMGANFYNAPNVGINVHSGTAPVTSASLYLDSETFLGAPTNLHIEGLFSTQNVHVDNSHFDVRDYGIYALNNQGQLRTDGNEFISTALTSTSGDYGIYADNSVVSTTVANLFDGLTTALYAANSDLDGIGYNFFEDGVTGVYLLDDDFAMGSGTSTPGVLNNVFTNFSNTAVYIDGVESGVGQFDIANNSFDANTMDVQIGGNPRSGTWLYIANNIFSDTGSPLELYDFDYSNLHNNLFQVADRSTTVASANFLGTTYTIDDLESTALSTCYLSCYHQGSKYDFHGLTYVDAAAGDYNLDPQSFGVDSGVTIPLLSLDMNRLARPTGGAFDIGAYEIDLSTDVDDDGDGLYYLIETAWGTLDIDTDYDADGYTDGDEVILLNQDPTVPDVIDTDGDGMEDDFEDTFGLDKTDPADAYDDDDSDGATNYTEYQVWNIDGGIMDPTNSDSDGDGLNDYWEIYYAYSYDNYGDGTDVGLGYGTTCIDPSASDASDDTEPDGLDHSEEYAEGTDPCDDDTDADGAIDGDEVDTYETDPLDDDSDDDGVLDGDEVDATGYDGSWTYDTVTELDPNNEDSDGDGLLDGEEWYGFTFDSGTITTDPTDWDTDGDEFGDGDEALTYETDPNDAADYPDDADFDGLEDAWEDLYTCVDSSVADASDDDDGDYLTHEEEQTAGTDPCNDDTDSDGVVDGYEVDTSYYESDWEFDTVTTLDPLSSDSDSDGLLDGEEWSGFTYDGDTIYTDPTSEDTDGDTLLDGDEVDGSLTFDGSSITVDPTDEDTDDDGYNDGEELDGSLGYVINPTTDDTDGDNLTDAEEISGSLGYVTDPTDVDTDTDGLDDDEEYTAGTDPTAADSDSDGVDDGDDVCPTETAASGYDTDADGCTDDTDGDGVGDDVDACPSTPSGATVDSSGCADSDGDGISDTDETAGTYGYVTDPDDADTDDDGVEDGDEITAGMDPTDDDTDADGMDDGWEYDYYYTQGYSTACVDPVTADDTSDDDGDGVDAVTEYGENMNPCEDDTDSDGMLDGYEYDYLTCLDPTSDDASSDADSDGLTNLEEHDGTYGSITFSQTNPCSDDTDSDSLPDEFEVTAYGATYSYCLDPVTSDSSTDDDGDGLNALTEYTYLMNPCDDDSDSDGMDDAWEFAYYYTDGYSSSCVNPIHADDSVDDDSDGFTNLEEYNGTYSTYTFSQTNPCERDTDGGGVDDFTEVTVDGTDPTDSADDVPTDTDGDGLNDADETSGTYGYVTDPYDADTDDDGLEDGDEYTEGTDPTDEDTDGDDFTDGYGEVDQGYDPTDSGDYPDLDMVIVGYENMYGYGSGTGYSTTSWTTGSSSYTSGGITHPVDPNTEVMFVMVESTNERVFGFQYDEDIYVGTTTTYICGPVSSSTIVPSDITGACTSLATAESTSSSWAPWSSLGSYYTFSEWTWFDGGTDTSNPYYFYQIRF